MAVIVEKMNWGCGRVKQGCDQAALGVSWGLNKVKWGYEQAVYGINRGLNALNDSINTHQGAIRDIVPVIKLIASIILMTVALSFSKLSFGLTLTFTALSMIHNLADYSPIDNAAKVFKNLWYTAFGSPTQNHQAVFALGVIAALAAPAIVVPVIAGSMMGDQLSKAVQAV